MTEKASGWCLSFFFLWLVLRMSGEDKNIFWNLFFSLTTLVGALFLVYQPSVIAKT